MRLPGEARKKQARRSPDDMYSYRAWRGRRLEEEVPEAVTGFRWFAEVCQPTLASVPDRLRGQLEGAELVHQILEHRWYMSEREGSEISIPEVLPAYVREILTKLSGPTVEASPLTPSPSVGNPGQD